MKKISLVKFLLAICCFSMVVFACKKDEDNSEATNQSLQGDWNVTSWLVDGDEQIGGILASQYTLEFDSLSGAEGYSRWRIRNGFGTETIIDGDYKVKNDGNILEFEGQDWDLDLNGDDLRIDGAAINDAYVLIAERE